MQNIVFFQKMQEINPYFKDVTSDDKSPINKALAKYFFMISYNINRNLFILISLKLIKLQYIGTYLPKIESFIAHLYLLF